jgi:predicted aldo/keto reductase-like oxidoreductase
MKYARLTKEQLEELQQEFVNFLATQSITASEWQELKQSKPQVAEDEIDVFSDLIWEGVLTNVGYVEHISEQQMHLFHLTQKEMKLIAIKVMNPKIDLTTQQGFQWFKKNWQSDFVEYMTASKAYGPDPNVDKFQLIQQGAVITKGELYYWFEKMMDTP